jgi:hypothetical protein
MSRSRRTAVGVAVLAAALVAPLSAGAVAQASPAAAPAPVQIQAGKQLSIKRQAQLRSYWCVPAVVRAMLSMHRSGSALPSQSVLASHMHTTKNGTSSRAALQTLNQVARKHIYDFNTAGSGSRLLSVIKASINRKHAVYASVWSNNEPWQKGGSKEGHAILAYGYSGNTIYWWDPADNSNHRASANASYSALKARGMQVITG